MTEPRTARWPGLDGLRAVAVLLVIGFHASGFLENGYLGVDIFFVLSGFLITNLLLREHQAHGRIDLLGFYGRRTRRLYPALAVTCVIVTIGALLVHQHVRQVGLGALASLAYFANIWEYSGGHDTYLLQHTWTLAIEEQFYLAWPLLLIAVLRWRFAIVIVAAGWIAIEICDVVLDQPPVLHTYVRAAGLPIGCVVAFALRSPAFTRWIARAAAPALLAVIALAAAPAKLETYLAGWPLGIAAILTAPIVVGLTMDSKLTRLLSAGPALWIGRRSYGLYLWHFPLLTLFINQAPQQIPLGLRILVGIGGAFVAAALSYRWIEQPFLRRSLRSSSHTRPMNMALTPEFVGSPVPR